MIYVKQINGYHIAIEEALLGQDKLIFKVYGKLREITIRRFYSKMLRLTHIRTMQMKWQRVNLSLILV
ncbi:hypothetical protein [Helicobacter cinaedi]|uniref:hypothetical protein n=1 Tax=Helicobacter cinaedi TaxID=213 RepID=UPI0011CB7821|nr:hypothetical protein [Helicobacter cinaedi]